MKPDDFANFLKDHPCILGEGAVIERLRRDESLQLDPHLVNSAFIYEETGRTALETICRQYIEIGRHFDLPLLISTPTWRSSRERIELAGFGNRDLNGDNTRFLAGIRDSYGAYADKIIICGLMSCRGNAYNPAEAMTTEEARKFHSWQALRLAEAPTDLLLAATLPALSEAIGLAQALGQTGKTYLISFVVRPEGTLLDGTSLRDAIQTIDSLTTPPPFGYLINCTHASFAEKALLHRNNSSDNVRERVLGILANTAALSPEELDESEDLIEEDPSTFAFALARLREELGLRILGGCCGTDDRHIRALAQSLTR